MGAKRFNIKLISALKDILLHLHNGESEESVRADVENYFRDANIVDTLLIELELINKDLDITISDVLNLSSIYPHLYNDSLSEEIISKSNYPGHPVQILKEENMAFQNVLNEINILFGSVEKTPQHAGKTDEIKQQILRLGEFHNHFNRKEKLFFPVMERYGYFDTARIMWKGDDLIRTLYQTMKRQVGQTPRINLERIRKTYAAFEKEFKAMIVQEEAILLPVLLSVFHENDWIVIAKESEAFGYAMIEGEKEWPAKTAEEATVEEDEEKVKNVPSRDENISFGGGYLTTEEANLILNNLPLEITFVDKNSMFKYFNEITEASEMMLVRTPISIGRNVANCHPPKSLNKVMTLVRDLKTKKRTSESMWFKKGDQYIHLTYKALFNEADEFLGVLEYVQDIQAFFDLPSEVKTGLSKIED